MWTLGAICAGICGFLSMPLKKPAISEQTAREVDTAALDAHLGSGYGIFSGRADLRAVL